MAAPHSPNVAQKRELPHSVTLKVMRLGRPSFGASVPLSAEVGDVAHGFKGAEQFGLSPAMRLAASFGEIYLGETFSCYVTVQNVSTDVVSNLVVKAELQTSSKRYSLHNLETNPVPSLAPAALEDVVLHRLIRDEGVHILVCTASYLTASMGRRSFRKFFKFNVTQPFTMAHRQLYCSAATSDVLVETELENSTPSTLCVSSVRLAANEAEFSLVVADSHPPQTMVYVPPSCAVQFVHRLRPLVNAQTGLLPNAASTMGYLELSWSRGWGELGTILSPPLYYTVPVKAPIEAELGRLEQLTAGCAARVACTVRNTHHYDTYTLTLILANEEGAGVLLCGDSGLDLPPLAPKQQVQVELTLLPLRVGLQRIGGLVLHVRNGERYVFDNLANVVVGTGAAQ